MNTNEKNEAIQNDGRQKIEFLNFKRWFWSKDRTKIFLVVSESAAGMVVVPLHGNFMKARSGVSYTPVPRKAKSESATNPQVA